MEFEIDKPVKDDFLVTIFLKTEASQAMRMLLKYSFGDQKRIKKRRSERRQCNIEVEVHTKSKDKALLFMNNSLPVSRPQLPGVHA